MKRRSFLSGLTIGSAACFLAGKSARAASLELPGPIVGKGKQVCEIDRRIYKVGEDSKIEVKVPEGFAESLRDIAIKTDNGEYQFDRQKSAKYEVVDGKIVIDANFKREDSYIIYFYPKGKTEKGKNKPPVEYQRVYALDEDLYALRPYKGDMHMHSRFSDGRDIVEIMGTRCLELGYGFQAVSDHRRYLGSQTLCKIFNPLPLTMRCFLAEECHQDPAPHVHSIGAKRGLTEYIEDNRQEYDSRVDEILGELPDDLTKSEALSVARAEAEFEFIRRIGGISGFDHPYWRMGERSLHLTKRVVDVLCSRCKFDFLELVNSGSRDDSTDLCVAALMEMRANGKDTPTVGSSDAHRFDTLGSGYTMVFAKSNNWSDIKDSILAQRSAVFEVFDPKSPRVFGKIRYMQYAYFLYQYYFPLHDKICAEEAKLLQAYFKSKTPENKKAIAKKTEEAENLYKKFYGV